MLLFFPLLQVKFQRILFTFYHVRLNLSSGAGSKDVAVPPFISNDRLISRAHKYPEGDDDDCFF